MPSSLIFVGLVVLWLLILVPTVARRQQEVTRLSPALLGGRVLDRPMRHRIPEVGVMERSGPTTVGELVEGRDGLPGSGRDGDRYDEGSAVDPGYDDEVDTEIDDDGRVYRRADDRDGSGRGGTDLHDLDDDELDLDELGDDELRDGAVPAVPRGASRDADRLDGRERDPRPDEGDVRSRGADSGGGRAGDRDDAADDAVGRDDRDDAGDDSGYDDAGYEDTRYDDELEYDELADGELDDEIDDELDDDDEFEDEFDAGFEDGHADSGADPENRYETDPEAGSSPPTRYRPGRGGFDPEAAAAAAHAKYAFRQRVVLALLVLVLAGVAVALLVAPVFWWVTGGLAVALAGYLTYLRRQVRIEEAIRARRAARLAGGHRAADDLRRDESDHDVDTPAHDTRGDRDTAARRHGSDDDTADDDTADEDTDGADDADAEERGADGTADGTEPDWTADDGEPTRVRGTGEPLGVLPARRRTVDGPSCTEHESSLPRLAAAPPPPVPDGTSLVDVGAEEDVDPFHLPGTHRPAVGE